MEAGAVALNGVLDPPETGGDPLGDGAGAFPAGDAVGGDPGFGPIPGWEAVELPMAEPSAPDGADAGLAATEETTVGVAPAAPSPVRGVEASGPLSPTPAGFVGSDPGTGPEDAGEVAGERETPGAALGCPAVGLWTGDVGEPGRKAGGEPGLAAGVVAPGATGCPVDGVTGATGRRRLGCDASGDAGVCPFGSPTAGDFGRTRFAPGWATGVAVFASLAPFESIADSTGPAVGAAGVPLPRNVKYPPTTETNTAETATPNFTSARMSDSLPNAHIMNFDNRRRVSPPARPNPNARRRERNGHFPIVRPVESPRRPPRTGRSGGESRWYPRRRRARWVQLDAKGILDMPPRNAQDSLEENRDLSILR